MTAWKLKAIEFRREILLSTRRFAEKKKKIWMISQKRYRISGHLTCSEIIKEA